MSVVPTTGPHAIANWRVFSYLGNVVTADSGGVTSTIVHDSFPDTASVFPAWSVATERNWYVWPSWPVNVPEVVAAVATSLSVTPTSGPHDTRNALRFSYWPNVFTWEPGPTVSTIVHVSLADGWDSWFPEASSAVVANSYTPSADAVNERKPKFPPGWTEYWIQIALPAVRYHRVTLATPVPFPSEAPYEIQKVSVFSYVGKGLAADVGASLSTITNDSVWLVPMSTDRGSLVKA